MGCVRRRYPRVRGPNRAPPPPPPPQFWQPAVPPQVVRNAEHKTTTVKPVPKTCPTGPDLGKTGYWWAGLGLSSSFQIRPERSGPGYAVVPVHRRSGIRWNASTWRSPTPFPDPPLSSVPHTFVATTPPSESMMTTSEANVSLPTGSWTPNRKCSCGSRFGAIWGRGGEGWAAGWNWVSEGQALAQGYGLALAPKPAKPYRRLRSACGLPG